jgi:hypothetical protein
MKRVAGVQASESYDNYAQYGYNSKIDGGSKNYYGAARRSGISGQWLYRYMALLALLPFSRSFVLVSSVMTSSRWLQFPLYQLI